MNGRRHLFAFPSWLILTALILSIPALMRGDDHKATSCSNASLRGSFGFYRTGFTADGALAALGILIFDGHGTAYVSQSISRNGELELDDSFDEFTYQVAPNCTGKSFFDGDVEFSRFVVVDGGRGLYFLSESAGASVFGVGTRIDAADDPIHH